MSVICVCLLYRHKCFTGKYTTDKIHKKTAAGTDWCIFNILSSEDIEMEGHLKFSIFGSFIVTCWCICLEVSFPTFSWLFAQTVSLSNSI